MNLFFRTFLNGSTCLSYIIHVSSHCNNCNFLILTDMSMPYMDGKELASKVINLKLKNNFKIVLISAEDYDNNE